MKDIKLNKRTDSEIEAYIAGVKACSRYFQSRIHKAKNTFPDDYEKWAILQELHADAATMQSHGFILGGKKNNSFIDN